MQLSVEMKGNGFPILCLHGHPGMGRSLSIFTDYLAQSFLTLAPDLRGYGKSRTSKPFEMADHLEDLGELLDKLKIERCLLLGWSLGGILALELMLRYPKRVSGLILIASAARPWGNHPAVNWQEMANAGIAGILNYLKPGWAWNIETFGKRSLLRYLIAQQTPLAYQYLARYGTVAYWQTSKVANQALNKALRAGYNRLEALHSIEVPCLVMAGEQDCHITAQASLETAQHLKQCDWICYGDTAHLFPWEIPQQVLNDIEQWLGKHPQMYRGSG